VGDYASDLGLMAWYGNNSGNKPVDAEDILKKSKSKYRQLLLENGGQTHEVGQKQPNAFGLYDMYGNVSEWCLDKFHGDYGMAPSDGSAWEAVWMEEDTVVPDQPKAHIEVVARGGSWGDTDYSCRSAVRFAAQPDLRHEMLGFRLIAFARQ
jgi:formylglycine-generating enzyme required for sulfatase activity